MKKSTFLFLITFAAVGLILCGCPTSKNKCLRTNNVSFWDIDIELNKVYHCPPMTIGCTGNATLSEFEMKDYYDLWSLATFNINSETFTLSEQDDILQIARAKAITEAPLCASGQKKLVYDINFLTDIITSGNPPGYIIGMKVKYACCSGSIPK